MAMRPSELKAQRDAEAAAIIEELSRKVEHALLDLTANWSQGVWVNTADYDSTTVESVRQEYLNAGWQVELKYDYREGNAIMLSHED